MSVSTLDSFSSVFALDRQAAAQDAMESEVSFAIEEIRGAFAQLGKMPAARIQVPYVQIREIAANAPRWMPMTEAVRDLLNEDVGVAELIAALEQSACPHVAAIRQAMCDRWIKNHAADIAEARL